MSKLDTKCYNCNTQAVNVPRLSFQEVVGWVDEEGNLVLQMNTGRVCCDDCLSVLKERYNSVSSAGDDIEKYTVDVRQYNIGFDAGWRGDDLAFTDTFYPKDFREGYDVGRSARSNA